MVHHLCGDEIFQMINVREVGVWGSEFSANNGARQVFRFGESFGNNLYWLHDFINSFPIYNISRFSLNPVNPTNNYLFKVNNRNTGKRCEIC